MDTPITLHVNGQTYAVTADPDTPLLTVLRHDLKLKGPKYGCGAEQCGACKVLVDGTAVPSCKLPIAQVQNAAIITIEGLGDGDALHPLQEAFIATQAIQCGYCASGMIIAAQGLLNRVRYPTDADIREALQVNLCRCGVYARVRRAIKLRIGRPEPPAYTVIGDQQAVTGNQYSVTGNQFPSSLLLPLPSILERAPDLDAWVRINSDETITLFTGKVEYGQGLQTAVAQIGAEELDVSLARIRIVMADTAQTPDEGMTVGSMSLETSGTAMRYAAAAARHHLLSIAYELLEAPLDRLVVTDGAIRDPHSGRTVTYWELMGGRKFGIQITGHALPKPPRAYTIVGQPASRLDLPAKVTGAPIFVHDIDLPGMVYGRILHPPHPHARLLSIDAAAVAALPGVLKVVQDGRFLGVIAAREEQAVAALDRLRAAAVWDGAFNVDAPDALYAALFSQPDQPSLIVNGTAVADPIPPQTTPTNAARTLRATYSRPYQMHAALGPSAAVAHWQDDKLTLWVHSQGVFPQRAAIAQVLGLDAADLHVIHRDGSGCYGHNGADDVALDAALLARALPGRPVMLQWSRADEHGWEPYAPAMQIQMQASLNDAGDVIDWQHEVWSPPHFGRARAEAGASGLLAAWRLAAPFAAPPPRPSQGTHSGSFRNADPLYTFPQRRIVDHHLPRSPLRTSAMRGLGAFANVFAIESFMDELARAAGADPVAFRLRHLADERARAVIEAAVAKAGPPPQGSGRGRGLAFAQYKNRQTRTAVLVDLRVDASSVVHLEHVVIAADAGQIINPDGLSNQLEGGFVQAASLALYEQVQWDETGVTSRDWDSYPILRFPDAPRMATVLLNHAQQPHVGGGEAAAGPTPAAIANAIFAATGIRLRQIPFTPARLHQAR